MWVSSLWEHGGLPLQWGVVLGASLGAAVTDWRWRRIPNALTGPMWLGGLVVAACVAGWAGLADSLLGCLLLAAPYVLLFLLAGGGAGDAKLMGAVGAWLGVGQGTIVLVTVAACGVVMAIGYAIAQRRVAAVAGHMGQITTAVGVTLFGGSRWRDLPGMVPDTGRMKKFPYGVAIAAGVWLAALGVLLWRT